MASYKSRTATDYIAVHCAATPPKADIGVAAIDRWHRAKGWNGVGYHRVIRRDGTIEQGRPDEAVGAHVEGFNSTAVGICLAGGVAADGHAVPGMSGAAGQPRDPVCASMTGCSAVDRPCAPRCWARCS